MNAQSKKSRGVVWMVEGCFWAACMGGVIRHLGDIGLHTFEIVFYRNVAALLLLLPWFIRAGGTKVLRTTRINVYVTRSLVGIVAMYFWFYALVKIPLADATALSFTAPLFTALLAVFFLKEKLGPHRITALLIGFAGMLVVLRPGTEIFQMASLMAVFSAGLWAFSSLMIKTLTNTDHPRVVVFYMVLLMTPLSLPLALPYIQILSPYELMWIFVLGLTSNYFQVALSHAFASTQVILLLPYDFLRLVFIAIVGYLGFGEVPDLWTFIGAGIILGGAVYTAYREALHIKQDHVL